MKATHIYLNFNGNCRAAMNFYGACLQAEPHFTPFSSATDAIGEAARTSPDLILHAELTSGPVTLMAADVPVDMLFVLGNNFSISLACESLAEMERLFAAFGRSGVVLMPMHDAFWGGRFGMLTDQFGIRWMLSFRAPEGGQKNEL